MAWRNLSYSFKGFIIGLVFVLITYSSYLAVAIGDVLFLPVNLLGFLFVIPQAIIGFVILGMNPVNTGHMFGFDVLGIFIWLVLFTLIGWLIGRSK